MKHERYMSWFREVVEMGWTCGLYKPQEILANYLHSFYMFTPYSEPFPFEHIERFIIDTTQHDWKRGNSERPTLQESVEHFDLFYLDSRMNFGMYTRLGVEDAATQRE